MREIRDGLSVDTEEFLDHRSALEAAGLSERQAMSQENVESFKRALDAYNSRDVEAMVQELDPEIEWHSAISILLSEESTVYRGHEGIRDLFREEFNDVLTEIHVVYSEIRDLGDRVLAMGRIWMRGRDSGVETESRIALVSDISNGKTTWIHSYLDPQEALEAAGLSE
ncbi:MAG: nuclear transport factor 2 family protein [Solirubrobacterales bacterium]